MIYLKNDNTLLQDVYVPRQTLLQTAPPDPFDPTNYYTKPQVDEKIEQSEDNVKDWVEGQGYITEEEDPTVPQVVKEITAQDIASWDNKSEFSGDYNDLTNKPSIPVNLSDLTNDMGFITNTVSNLVNYYTNSETYTKSEVNALVQEIPHFKIEVVDELPTTGDSATVYLVRNQESTGTDLYDEWIYVNNRWEHLGSARIDLSNYYTKAEVNVLLNGKQNTLTAGEGISIVNDVISALGGSSDVLEAVDELPASGNEGDVVALKVPAYGGIVWAQNGASTTNSDSATFLTHTFILDEPVDIRTINYYSAMYHYMLVEDGVIEVRVKYTDHPEGADLDLLTTWRAGESGATTIWSNSAHTANQRTITWNWTNEDVLGIAYPNSNNIVSTSYPQIGYDSTLYRYTSLAKWGRWYGAYPNIALANGTTAQFVYDYFPQEAHHTKLCEYKYTSSYYSNTGFIYLDTQTPRLLIYSATGSAFTPDFSVEPTYSLRPGETGTYSFGIGSGKITWNGNIIKFSEASYDGVNNLTAAEIAEGWERVIEDTPDFAPTNKPSYPFIGWDSKGRVVNIKGEASEASIYINHSGYSNQVVFLKTSGNPPSRIYVPTASGETGTVLVSQGGTAAPQFKDFYTQYTAGIHFWVGDEESYDAIAVKDNSTLYIIRDE